MSGLDTQVYCPVLRLKAGERDAVALLSADVRSRLLPLFVAPPPSEKDTELGRHLSASELVAVTAERVGKTWPLRPCLLDPRFLFQKLSEDNATTWLPDLFRQARRKSAQPWIVADLRTLDGTLARSVAIVLAEANSPFALRLKPEDIEDEALTRRIQRALLSVVRKPSETLLVLDFGNSLDFSSTSDIADVMVSTLARLLDIGLWSQVIWQATSYPEINPAQPGGLAVLPRGEWLSFEAAWSLDPASRKYLMFGDFAADSAKFNFSNGKGIPAIAHFRYSTKENWLVSRGVKDAKLSSEMPKIAERIVSSDHFAGAHFSRGDRYIQEAAWGHVVGQAKNWRCANATHHLTQVIQDIGALAGFTIERVPALEQAFQGSLDL